MIDVCCYHNRILFLLKKVFDMVANKQYSLWFLFVFLSLCAAGLSYKYFDQVAPIVQLSITADRQQIIDQALTVASELNWNLAGYQTAVEFDSDDNLQCFVELEGGGKQAFVEMFQLQRFYPYQWKIRFFKEKEVVEMRVNFSPDGHRIGFSKKISEMTQGKALSQDEAQLISEKSIIHWCHDFENYTLVEYDSEKQDSGRVDHSFVFERTDISLGKGLYRFQAVVSGDELTKLEPFVKIPDNFKRRYQEMRSANNLLALVGSFLLKMLYLFIFCLFGLIYFYRRNYLLVKPACITALFVAGLEFLSGLNNYPLWWNSYNTIQSSSTYILIKCFECFLNFCILLSVIFAGLVVAEAAGRAVYKYHTQFFKMLNWQALSSTELFKQVAIGYLWTPFEFGYVILFLYITETYFGWWSPSSSLSDPNVIASIFPWFGAISMSLRAGFGEEVLFRALPIAMIAVLTQKSKHKKWWFTAIFILQALIFGACHANYPNQPFFTRLVELIIPSFNFGFLYYRFGLIPGTICHFVYDAILFALPVFSSNLFWSKIIVLFLIGLPLWIVLAVLVYNKKLYALPGQYFNQAFIAKEYIPTPVVERKIGDAIPRRNMLIVLILGFLGFGLIILTNRFCPDTGPLLVTKSQAIACATQAVQEEFGVDVFVHWQPICTVQDDADSTSSRFVWQLYGKDMYQKMQGSYLQGESWMVRFVQFSRPIEDRSEEYRVVISNCCRCGKIEPKNTDPRIIEIEHKLPELYQGADLSQEQALIIAYEYIKNKFGLTQDETNLISVVNDKLENRRDWTVIVQALKSFDFYKEGQARIQLIISGDIVTKYSRTVHTPEDWTRADKSIIMNIKIIKLALYFLMILFIMFGSFFGFQKLLQSTYGNKIILHKGLFMTMLVAIVSINSFCMQIGTFNTAEPFYDQYGRRVLQIILQNSWQVMFCSLFMTIAAVGFIKGRKPRYLQSVGLSTAIGLCIQGVWMSVSHLQMILEPQSSNCGFAGSWSPIIALCSSTMKYFCLLVSIIIPMFLMIKFLQKKWPDRIFMQVLSVILFCISLESICGSESILIMILRGFAVGLIVYGAYRLILQYDMTLLPFIIAIITIIDVPLPELFYPSYIGSQLHAVCAIILMMIVGFFFYERSHVE